MNFSRLERFLKIVLAVLVLSGSTAFADSYRQLQDRAGKVTDDRALVAAMDSGHNVFYVEAGNLVVSKILPDDTNGLPHQKWQARLSNGTLITVVYNSDMGDRVPVQEGIRFSVGGQFIWTGHGGLIHWLHQDPKRRRPDGYVFINGVIYGDSGNDNN